MQTATPAPTVWGRLGYVLYWAGIAIGLARGGIHRLCDKLARRRLAASFRRGRFSILLCDRTRSALRPSRKVIEPREQLRAVGRISCYITKLLEQKRPRNTTQATELVSRHKSIWTLQQLYPFQSPSTQFNRGSLVALRDSAV